MNQTGWNPPISQFSRVKTLLLKTVAGWNPLFFFKALVSHSPLSQFNRTFHKINWPPLLWRPHRGLKRTSYNPQGGKTTRPGEPGPENQAGWEPKGQGAQGAQDSIIQAAGGSTYFPPWKKAQLIIHKKPNHETTCIPHHFLFSISQKTLNPKPWATRPHRITSFFTGYGVPTSYHFANQPTSSSSSSSSPPSSLSPTDRWSSLLATYRSSSRVP